MFTKLRAASLVLVLSFAGLAAGCGGDDDNTSSDGLATITMGVSSVSLPELPIWVAQNKGFFEDEGVKVDIKAFTSGSETLTAVLSGSIDITAGEYSSMLQAVAQKQKVEYIANMRRVPGYVLVVSPKHPEITSMADLEGKPVGVSSPGGGTYNTLRYALSKNGVDIDKLTYLAVGLTTDAIAAMERGSVVAAAMQDPAVTELAKRSSSPLKILYDYRTPETTDAVIGTNTLISTGIYANANWVPDNGDNLKKMLAGLVKALQWIHSATPEEIADAVSPTFEGVDKETLATAIAANKDSYSEDGKITQADAELALTSLTTSQPDLGDISLDGTYTNDYLP